MYVGTQIVPRDDSDYRVWAQLGVIHVCVDPPGSPHYWSADALRRHKDHVESFGLSLDMVQLPIPSGPIEVQDRPHILLARDPERQREIDGLCGLIERLAAAGDSRRQVQSQRPRRSPHCAGNRARRLTQQSLPLGFGRSRRAADFGRGDL